jgi:hypothetical protein
MSLRLSTRAHKLLVRLALLNRTEGQPDSPENPVETRKSRVLSLRKELVRVLGSKFRP